MTDKERLDWLAEQPARLEDVLSMMRRDATYDIRAIITKCIEDEGEYSEAIRIASNLKADQKESRP